MRIKKIFLLFLVLLQTIIFSSNAKSMGNAFTGISGDISGINYNPASIGNIFGLSFLGEYRNVFPVLGSVTELNMAISHPLIIFDNRLVMSVVGLSYSGLSLKDMYEDETITGTVTYNFGQYRFVRKLGIQDFLFGMQFGIRSFQYIYNDLSVNPILENNNKKSVYILNAGMLLKGFLKGLQFGISGKNLLTPNLTLENIQDENSKSTYTIGVSYLLDVLKPISMLFDIDGGMKGDDWFLNSGIEIGLNDLIFIDIGNSITSTGSFNISSGIGYIIDRNNLNMRFNMGATFVPLLVDTGSSFQNISFSVKIFLN